MRLVWWRVRRELSLASLVTGGVLAMVAPVSTQGPPTRIKVHADKLSDSAAAAISTDLAWAEAVVRDQLGPLPDTVVVYADTTLAFPLFCEYAVGSPAGRRPRKALVHRRADLVAALKTEAARAARERPEPSGSLDTMPDLERHR